MPVDNITISTASPQGNSLKNLVSQVYNVRNMARQILEQMQEQTNATDDFTHIETQYGLVTGQGANVYSLVFALANGANNGSGLENSAIKTFCARLN